MKRRLEDEVQKRQIAETEAETLRAELTKIKNRFDLKVEFSSLLFNFRLMADASKVFKRLKKTTSKIRNNEIHLDLTTV